MSANKRKDDTFYANKVKRKELSDMSEKIFGVRGKWKKLVLQRGATIEEIEESMTNAIRTMEEKIERLLQGTKNEAARDGREASVPATGTSIEEASQRSEQIRAGKEVRQGETKDVPTITGGDN